MKVLNKAEIGELTQCVISAYDRGDFAAAGDATAGAHPYQKSGINLDASRAIRDAGFVSALDAYNEAQWLKKNNA